VAEAGFVNAVSSIAMLNTTLAGLGIGTAAVRGISAAKEKQDWKQVSQLGGVAFLLSLSFGVIGFVLLSFGAGQIVHWARYEGAPGTAATFCILMGVSFLFSQVNSQFLNYLQAFERFDLLTMLSLAFGLANGICGIIFLRAWPSILTIGITSALLSCLYTVALWGTAKRVMGCIPSPRWSAGAFRELWSFGKWVYLTSVSGLFTSGLDRILLVSMFGSKPLPAYALARRMYETCHGILANQAGFLFPMISAAGEGTRAIIARVDDRVRWFLGVISVWIYSALLLFGPPLLALMISTPFAKQCTLPLAVFCLVGVIHAQAIATFNFAYASGHAKINAIYHIATGIVTLPFMYVMGRAAGASAMVVGQLAIAVITPIYIVFYYRALGVQAPFSRCMGPIAPTLATLVLPLTMAALFHCGCVGVIGVSLGGAAFLLAYLPSILRLEGFCRPDSERLRTLREAAKQLRLKSKLLGALPSWFIGLVAPKARE
jgi:O-antigen/teichoic acid export membrane protein